MNNEVISVGDDTSVDEVAEKSDKYAYYIYLSSNLFFVLAVPKKSRLLLSNMKFSPYFLAIHTLF